MDRIGATALVLLLPLLVYRWSRERVGHPQVQTTWWKDGGSPLRHVRLCMSLLPDVLHNKQFLVPYQHQENEGSVEHTQAGQGSISLLSQPLTWDPGHRNDSERVAIRWS